MFFYYFRISNSRVSTNSFLSFVSIWGKRLLAAFESSYKKRTYQDKFFKLKPGVSVTEHFFNPSGAVRFPFRWSSFVTPSPRVAPNNFSIEEKGHVDVFEKLLSDIITLELQRIRCIKLIRHAKDLAILQQHFSESFCWLCFRSLILLMLVT